MIVNVEWDLDGVGIRYVVSLTVLWDLKLS